METEHLHKFLYGGTYALMLPAASTEIEGKRCERHMLAGLCSTVKFYPSYPQHNFGKLSVPNITILLLQ